MTARFRIPFFTLLVLLMASLAARPFQQITDDGSWTFSESDFTVSGEFLDLYKQTDEYLLHFGLPITDVVDHPVYPGAKSQYFQRARMDLYPNEPEGQRVRLAPLGVWLYDETRRGKPANLPYVPSVCRMFEARQIPVCYDFLKFYEEHEGEIYFGEPIAPMEKLANNRIVQYFERARLEYWPENPPDMRVMLTDVGRIDCDITCPKPGSNPGSSGNIPFKGNIKLTVHAFSARPLVAPNSTQTVYVIVQNQSLQPQSGVLVTLSVLLPNGQLQNHRLAETDLNGLSKIDLSVGAYKPNQIVEVTVQAEMPQGPEATTSTYFRIWW
jgi:hypothetical protein